MTETTTTNPRDVIISQGVQVLVNASGENSSAHGFHDDWPTKRYFDYLTPELQAQVRRAIAEKLALVHEEVSEALGEIRSGRAPLDIYYLLPDGTNSDAQLYDDDGAPLGKPEGFLVELADGIIRSADLAYLVGDRSGGHLAHALAMKAEYNTTRPHKHGREF